MEQIKFIVLLVSMNCFFISFTSIAVSAQEIFFIKHYTELWKTDPEGTHVEKVCQVPIEGSYHQISPDGKWLAMVTGFERSRVIALFHLETKQIRTLPIPAKQCSTPRWSPDGQKIAFEFLDEDRMWKVGVIDVNGKNFDIVSNKSHWTFLGCWTNSGRTILYYDHTYIYEIDLRHTLVNTIPWSHLKGSVYGGIRFSLSDDQRYVLYHAVIEDEYIKGMMGPVDAIFVYDMETGFSKRVSPIGMFTSEPHWIPGTSQFIYRGTTEKDVRGTHRIRRIYRDSLDKLEPSLLADDGRFLSVSMPNSKELKIED